jgi:hypothetical protein
VVIAMAMVGVAALAVWARRHRPLSRAIAGTELELFALALLFAAGVTLERGASPWAEWPDLVRHFGGVLLRSASSSPTATRDGWRDDCAGWP